MEFTTVAAFGAALYLLRKLQVRLRLSHAKHRSLSGHARISRLLARQVPFYAYDEDRAFSCDGAGDEIAAQRRRSFFALAEAISAKTPQNAAQSLALAPQVSDLQFTHANRVPFQFRALVNRHFQPAAFASATNGVRVRDIDGNWAWDVSGSYGVNLLGYDFYKGCIERAVDRVRQLGPVLGPYHPIVADNARRICAISGLDEVSFHMSGTEAVMQAVRLARFHTRRSQLVVACGAYHGWWDGVQAGVGHNRSLRDIYMLKEQSEDTLRVLRTRKDIACVLVNPLQALHPNSGASSDAMLIDSSRAAGFDKLAYRDWLQRLREVCTERGIVLIFDEVFVGFRLGLRGAQAFFGVDADMVTYGKTIGGGLPVGVLAGKAELMQRYREDRPADVCFARGTFNAHPYVMATMNEFLRHTDSDEYRADVAVAAETWDRRIATLNERLDSESLPLRLHNLSSICLVQYTRPARFNWMLQFYLRDEGLGLSWVGTGRFIFSHNYTDEDFSEVAGRIVTAARRMRDDGWWPPSLETTNATIRKQVLWEILRARLGRRQAIASGSSAEASSSLTT